MKNASTLFRRGAWVLGTALVFVQQAAQACPGCKQAASAGGDGSNLSGASVGFSLGVLFMIGMVVAVLGILGRMMYRSCLIIAAQQRAAMEQEDVLGGAA